MSSAPSGRPGCVVISPHLDDAVLSCCGRLLDGDVEVITVCAGLPPDGAPLSDWDRDSGATSARQRAVERLAEDDAALASLGVSTRRLDELGQHYRGAPFDVASVADRLTEMLQGAREVWLPAGVGGHGAHVGTSHAAMDAVRRLAPEEVVVYVDLPYAIDFGWPHDGHTVDEEMRRRGHDLSLLSAFTRRLSDAEQQRKLAAAQCYRSQLALLGMTADGRFSDPAADAVELAYRTAATNAAAFGEPRPVESS